MLVAGTGGGWVGGGIIIIIARERFLVNSRHGLYLIKLSEGEGSPLARDSG